ncbi:hypothetical protein OSSY52_20480 [Tepiditoga spiralis]|uniref:Protein-arginine rhamnosyltransferase n=1 Tax=Tepiditoga spiralis TaxID=2108365 RepID=A0A7G1GA33_9BACT|nr:elongation factor P maturation arginine rhamnosyltransferase EarP [Tepiditoga spiralis]BBE31907.1 hypothetical protein OSSY52_20480 [Tepiditoga spiralis]
MKIDIFCTVIDNYGDAGYTLRMAMALRSLKTSLKIRIYTDYKELFLKLKPKFINDIDILSFNEIKKYEASDVCIGMFQYFPNDFFINKINKNSKKFIVIDYFTSESWADEVNGNNCLHNGLNIPCEFYVPGLSNKSLGVLTYTSAMKKTKVNNNIYLYTPEKLKTFIDLNDSILWSGNINNIKKMNFKTQDIFDSYILGAKYNWIRGEDSFQLALWSGIPFFWEAYPQKNEIKKLKIDAFLNFMKPFLDEFYQSYYNIILYINNFKKTSIKESYLFINNNYNDFKNKFMNLNQYFLNRKSFQKNLIKIIEIL